MPFARRSGDLLGEIEAAAHDPDSDLATVLRKCITLGGVTGSERLREWAARELKGYKGDDTLPDYRQVVAPLVMDCAKYNAMIQGQQVPLTMIPEGARDWDTADCPFPQPVAELAHLLSSARRSGEDSVRLAPLVGRRGSIRR
jgi:AbiTii